MDGSTNEIVGIVVTLLVTFGTAIAAGLGTKAANRFGRSIDAGTDPADTAEKLRSVDASAALEAKAIEAERLRLDVASVNARNERHRLEALMNAGRPHAPAAPAPAATPVPAAAVTQDVPGRHEDAGALMQRLLLNLFADTRHALPFSPFKGKQADPKDLASYVPYNRATDEPDEGYEYGLYYHVTSNSYIEAWFDVPGPSSVGVNVGYYSDCTGQDERLTATCEAINAQPTAMLLAPGWHLGPADWTDGNLGIEATRVVHMTDLGTGELRAEVASVFLKLASLVQQNRG